MLTSLINELYGGEKTSIPVDGSPKQAAGRLAHSTPRRAGLTFMDKVVGSVTVDRVALRFRHRSAQNAFAPIFRGRFETLHGKTYLTGRFGLRRFTKVFMTVWFGLIALVSIAGVVVAVERSSAKGLPPWTGILVGGIFACGAIAFGFAGFVLLRRAKRLSKADVDHVVEHVKSSFTKNCCLTRRFT